EHVQEQALIIALPAVREKTGFRPPAVRERWPPVPRPIPVGPAVKRIGDAPNLDLVVGVGAEVGGGGEHAREQERRIDGGQFTAPHSPAGLKVEKVIKESLVSGGVRLRSLREVVQEPESSPRHLSCEWPVEDAALGEHRECGQAQANGSNA